MNFLVLTALNHTESGWFFWLPLLVGSGWWSWELLLVLLHHKKLQKWSQPRNAIPTAICAWGIFIVIARAPDVMFLALAQEWWVSLVFLGIFGLRLFFWGTLFWKIWHLIQHSFDVEESLKIKVWKARPTK